MISQSDLQKIAQARLRDAEALLKCKRYDGAIYLCGYTIELALKSRICKTLKWNGYPSSRREFDNYQSFRTHDLDILLHLSGIEYEIKTKYLAEWSVVATWDPEARYRPIGSATRRDAKILIQAVKVLLRVL